MTDEQKQEAERHSCWHAIEDSEHECSCDVGEPHGAADVSPECQSAP